MKRLVKDMFTFTFLRNVLLLVYNLAAILLHNWSYCTKILYIEKYTDPIYFRPFYPFNYGIFGIKIDRVSMSVRIQDRAKEFASVEGMCGGGGATVWTLYITYCISAKVHITCKFFSLRRNSMFHFI